MTDNPYRGSNPEADWEKRVGFKQTQSPSGIAIRIKLTEEHFRELCAGKVVTIPHNEGWQPREGPDVEIILADIGFGLMLQAVETAMSGAVADDQGPKCRACSKPSVVTVKGIGYCAEHGTL